LATQTDIPSLGNLAYIPYIDSDGQLPEHLQSQVGVYAIFDSERILQFVGYSRNVYLSLQQHLVRQPQLCYWLKAQTIDRPNRTLLEDIRNAWISENGSTPVGNGLDDTKWTQSIDAKSAMTAEEEASYLSSDELTQAKLLKNAARRVEKQILAELESRGLVTQIRFNPKLKEKGLLDIN
jgi:hypothetical protein